MNPLEQLRKIKAFFNDVPAAAPTEPAPVQLMEYTLEDGTVVMIDKLEAGGMVSIGDAPAPAGDHKLADGTVITVGEGGVISAVVAPAAPESEPEDMTAQYTQRFSAIETKLQGFESALATATQENAALKETFAKQEALNQQFIQMFETLIKEPDTAPTQQPNTFRRITAQTKDERIKSFSNSISNILKTSKNGI